LKESANKTLIEVLETAPASHGQRERNVYFVARSCNLRHPHLHSIITKSAKYATRRCRLALPLQTLLRSRLRRRSSPLQCRDRTSSHSSTDQRSHVTIHQIFCFIVVTTIPSSFVNIGWNTCIIYAMLNATIYFFLVETKGNNVILNNITEIFFRSSCQGYVLRREVSFLTYLGTLLSS